MASCFQHVVHITDNEHDKPLISFPPEPFFMHPLAEACTKQLRDKKHLTVVPPLHHHTHDFILTVDKNICVVVGEAKSGKDFRKELDKCLTGMCKALQFMNYSVGVTSSERRCSVHLGYTAVRSVHGSQWTQCLKVDSVTVCKGFGESEYGGYIDKILDALVACLNTLVNSDGLLLTPQEHFMHPGTLLEGYSRSTPINIPGLYTGVNAGWVKEEVLEMYEIWKQGHWNRQHNRAFPQYLQMSDTKNMIFSFLPMRALHLKECVERVHSEDKNFTGDDTFIAGKKISR